jgi:pimeloyl-ACP methyl ester carboxylesterase
MAEVYNNLCLLFNKDYKEEIAAVNKLYKKRACIKEPSQEDIKLIKIISCAAFYSTKLSFIKLRPKIQEINRSLSKELQITLPLSYSKLFYIKISLPLRISTVLLTDIIHLSIKIFSAITKSLTLKHKKVKIFKKHTPILLIHGYTGNRTVFCLFRRLLENKNTGHVFTMNLNKEPGKNDKKSIADFAIMVEQKIEEIKAEYAKNNITMKKIHLVGYSMGGLIAAQTSINKPNDIASVTTLSTPWEGSHAAHIKGFTENDLPECAFVPSNQERKSLKNAFLANQTPKTTFSGGLDIFVRPQSSMLCLPKQYCGFSFWDTHHSIVYNPFTPRRVREKIFRMEKFPLGA